MNFLFKFFKSFKERKEYEVKMPEWMLVSPLP